MPYALARLFSRSVEQSPEHLDRTARQELVPQLLQIPGLRCYSTLQLHDGRIGSFSVYESCAAAHRGLRVASEWVSNTEAVRTYQLDETLRGEIIYRLVGHGDQHQRNACGVARIYQSRASIDEVKAAIEQEAAGPLQHLPGLLRYSIVKLEDGRVGSFAAFTNHESEKRLSELVGRLRARNGSALNHVLPHDPQVVEGIILGTYTP